MKMWFSWSDTLNKRACRYLLQRYLGQYLQVKLSLDQLSVDLYNGKGSISDVYLDVEALNDISETYNLPLEFLDGYIASISLAVPWSALLSENSEVIVHGLTVTVQPKHRSTDASMFDSMWGSMTTSFQLAEECLHSPLENETESELSQNCEGLEAFARTIETVLCKVKVQFLNVVIRVENLPENSTSGVAMEIHIKRVDYFDEAGVEDPCNENKKSSERSIYEPVAFSVKKFFLEGTSLYTDQFSSTSRTFSKHGSVSSTKDSSQPLIPGSPEMPPTHSALSSKITDDEKISSDPILISRLTGQQEIRLKLKQNEAATGPKVDVEFNLGSVNFLLSPHQVHILLDLARGLTKPEIVEETNAKKYHPTANKPMKAADYALVEQELQRQQGKSELPSRSLQNHRGWSSHSLDDSDEEFHLMTMENRMSKEEYPISQDLESSCSSIGSETKLSSAGSSSQNSFNGKRTSKLRGSNVQALLQDPLSELTQFRVSSSSVCLIILHEDTIAQTLQCEDHTSKIYSGPPSLLRNRAEKFFDEIIMLAMEGYNFKDFDSVRDPISKLCSANHLRFMASGVTIEGNEKSSSSQRVFCSSSTIAKFEILECLFNLSSEDPKYQKPNYTEILSFSNKYLKTIESKAAEWREPSIKVKYQQIECSSQLRILKQPVNKVTFHLGPFYTDIDMSLLDRIHSLLYPQLLPFRREKKQDSSVWKEEEDEFPTKLAQKTEIHMESSFVILNLRFPVPDLRPLHDMDRVPWWQQNLHKETLHFDLTDASLSTTIDSEQLQKKIAIQCRDVHGYCQETPSSHPVSFLRISVDPEAERSDRENGFDWPRLVIYTVPQTASSILESEGLVEKEETFPESWTDTVFQADTEEATPFSSHRVIHGAHLHYLSETQHNKSTTFCETDKVIMPAEKQKIQDFIEKTVNKSQYYFEFFLPTAHLSFPNKHFFELLYNRLSSDLVLWESAVLVPPHKCDPSSFKIHAPGLDLSSQILKDSMAFQTFSTCHSDIHNDSSSDSEENNGIYYSVHEHWQRQKQKQKKVQTHKLTKISVKLIIKKGSVEIHCPLRDNSGNVLPSQCGKMQLHLEDCMFFAATSYRGDANESYVCLTSNKGTLYHNGMVVLPMDTPKMQVPTTSPADSLHPTIYLSEAGVPSKPGLSVGTGGDSLDMLTVSVHITNDIKQQLKTFKVALGLQGTTLRHFMTPAPQNWLTQLMDFLNVEEYPVYGYHSPAVVTELHLHLWNCAIDYRPLYLPLRTILTVENFSMSSNIAACTTSLLLRIISEELCLFISNNVNSKSVDLIKNYVCVLDTGLIELSLCVTSANDYLHPKLEMRATNNMVHIRTCADSCRALQSLIMYLASDGDLTSESTNIRDSEVQLVMPDYSESEAKFKTQMDVHNLMAEAMKECSYLASDQTECHPESTDGKKKPETCTDFDLSNVDEEFCILGDDPGVGLMPKNGEPQIRILTNDPIRMIENHFSIPSGKSDQLKAPKNFPIALFRYTLREMSITWHLYGGNDFEIKKSCQKKQVRIKKENTKESTLDSPRPAEYGHSTYINTERNSVSFYKIKSQSQEFDTNNLHYSAHVGKPTNVSYTWLTKGGSGRKHDVLMELQMNKVKFQHEVYPEGNEQASRYVLLIHDIEIRDRLASSQINKFLYQYASEAMPRQSHANMIVIKALHIRPDPNHNSQECSLRVSCKPLRLNIDQDALLFLYNFFGDVCGLFTTEDSTGVPVVYPTSPHVTPTHGEKASIILQDTCEQAENLISPSAVACTSPSSTVSAPTFFRSFVFSPDVLIRVDYHGKRVDMEQGALAGLLMGLGQLNCSELRLKRLCYRHGLLGIEKLFGFAVTEWLQDIKKNQLPSLLGGVGPMHSFVQLFQGIRDLVWLPIEQYRKDGRIVRGLQRGATSFTTSTAMAVLELTNRVVNTIQGAAEVAYDMVSPGPSVKNQTHGVQQQWRRSSQPADIREGMVVAYNVVKEGLGDTARMIVRVASEEHEHKGMSGAVGGVLRQIPPSVVKPIILSTEATSIVFAGVRNQLVPDAHREAVDKWRIKNK